MFLPIPLQCMMLKCRNIAWSSIAITESLLLEVQLMCTLNQGNDKQMRLPHTELLTHKNTTSQAGSSE